MFLLQVLPDAASFNKQEMVFKPCSCILWASPIKCCDVSWLQVLLEVAQSGDVRAMLTLYIWLRGLIFLYQGV